MEMSRKPISWFQVSCNLIKTSCTKFTLIDIVFKELFLFYQVANLTRMSLVFLGNNLRPLMREKDIDCFIEKFHFFNVKLPVVVNTLFLWVSVWMALIKTFMVVMIAFNSTETSKCKFYSSSSIR
jgi:hypothetical protein